MARDPVSNPGYVVYLIYGYSHTLGTRQQLFLIINYYDHEKNLFFIFRFILLNCVLHHVLEVSAVCSNERCVTDQVENATVSGYVSMHACTKTS